MNRLWLTAAAGAVLVGTTVADSRFPIEDRETIRRSLAMTPGRDATLVVSNINGAIAVIGGDAPGIELVAERTIRARTEVDRDEARRALQLETRETTRGVLVCEDAARRCGCDERTSRAWRHWDEPRYIAETRLELRVPHRLAVRLCSINGGGITVSHTTGGVEVDHVNGGIEVVDIRGAARLVTVNGSIRAAFPETPLPSSFRSVNGSIEASFPRSLAADLRLQTRNGGIFTDFETTGLPQPAATVERRNGKSIYRSSGAVHVRVSSGGPALSFETLNGDVRVLQR